MDPTHLGPFTLLDKLGEGGMGVVYKARDTRLDRFVAIKLLPEARIADSDRLARFIQEARAASALNHPNIITIYDIAEQDGRHYIVMEFVDGKPLNLLIPRKGMRLADGLRVATQAADALTAAHAAGIVHRDLKPGNIMVDASGRTKVLDFGLAKLTAPRETAPTPTDETRTVAMDAPRTEQGVIVGSVPYMSPEQAEGYPVDARSDIFSFGAVLYEIFTGQRAFPGESRISTLAAVVERDPAPMSEAVPGMPPDLERVITRCLRKDLARRSQHMSDVKLALEELLDDAESGKLARASGIPAPATPAKRRWLWPAAGAACLAIAGVVAWAFLHHTSVAPAAPQLVRVTPEDGYSYTEPAISPDGNFVASISDRGGSQQVWLQQVGGGDPIQVTHTSIPARSVSFFPEGTRLLVGTYQSGRGTVEVVPTLGGQSHEIAAGDVFDPSISPDGKQVAYFAYANREYHLNILPADGGTPRALDKWAVTQSQLYFTACAWLDSQRLLVGGSKRRGAPNLDEWEWFMLPLDGGDPVATGAGDALRSAGLGITWAQAITGHRLFFGSSLSRRGNVWELRLTPGTWQAAGRPRQITFGTETERITSISANGTAALETSRHMTDFYLIPVDPQTGHGTGPARRLTQDGRDKHMRPVSGDPGILYSAVMEYAGKGPIYTLFSINLATSRQTELNRNLTLGVSPTLSMDGRRAAWNRAESDRYTISVAPAGSPLESAKTICNDCGFANRFTPDGRFLVCDKGARPNGDPNKKSTVALLEISTGKFSTWLDDPAESITVNGFLVRDWALVSSQRGADSATRREWLVPFRPEPVPRSEWIEFHPPATVWKYGVQTPFIYGFKDGHLMAIHFDAKQRRMSDPFAVRLASGGPAELSAKDNFNVRGPGIAFERELVTGTAWLMKLP